MKKIIISSIFILLAFATSLAQQPRKVTRTWFPNPDVKIETPAFKRNFGYTTYKEMMKFLRDEASANPQLITIENVGKTQKNRDIPLVVVRGSGADDGKLRVLYTGCVHGNEHAGTEGLLWFIHQLASDNNVRQLLDGIDFYIMPMVNIDGSEADSRYTNNGTDPNRDQTRLSTPEVQCMHLVASRVKPHVFIDFHEYKPLRSSYSSFSKRIISNPNDYMYLYSSNPNVYPGLTNVVENHFIPEAEKMARQWGLVTSLYYTTKSSGGKTVMNIGGQAARSSSNIMALRGCVSMLMEIRGVGLGRTSYLRRVNTAYQLACTYAQAAKNNAGEILRATNAALHQQRDIVTGYEVPVEKDHSFEFIDLLGNKKMSIAIDAHLAKNLVVKKKVARPEAYYISASETLAIDLIKKFGIEYETLTESATLPLESYTVTQTRRQWTEVLGIYPVNVQVRTERHQVTLPAGSIRVSMSQPLATLAGILLEPECANGFVNFCVIEAKTGTTLQIYRSVGNK